MKKIIPALLTNDLDELKDKLKRLENLVDWAQIDIMDNKFVSNGSITIKDLASVKTRIRLEAHLMIFHPEDTFADCEKLGIKRVIFHFEAVENVEAVLKKAKEFNFDIGISINPSTSIEKIKPYLEKIDFVLFMSVNPGFQGQGFILDVLDKIKILKKMMPDLKIEIDGGVNVDNIKSVADAGVDDIVVGSAVFKGGLVEENLKKLKEIIGINFGCGCN